jgi:hypothetical protein
MYNVLQDNENEELDKPSRIIDSTIALNIYAKEFNALTAKHII